MTVRGTTAYAPQDPWYVVLPYRGRYVLLTCQILRIMSASVRENILFSHEYDETFYQLVIEGKSILSADTH